MAYSAPPARTEISDTYPNPSNAVARVGFGKLWDYVTGLLGATGSPPAARTALGLVIGTDVQAYSGTLQSYATVSTLGFKNRIINGAMMIDQRNAGASGTAGSGGVYILDRWFINGSQGSKLNYQQNAGGVTPPTGFKKYLGVNVGATATIGSSDYFFIGQRIEGFNIADLGFGASGASTVDLSFQVYSSVTGTFSGSLVNGANNRAYPFTYTVSSANTWTAATVSITGDTSGTWASDNTSGMEVRFNLGSGSTYLASSGAWGASNAAGATGSVSIMGTSGATFYITGVQLEKGSTATSFDYRPYGTELALCQRYYQFIGGVANSYPLVQGYGLSTKDLYWPISFPVQMRAAPTVVKNGTWSVTNCGQPTFLYANTQGGSFTVNASANGNVTCFPDSTDDTFTFSSEL